MVAGSDPPRQRATRIWSLKKFLRNSCQEIRICCSSDLWVWLFLFVAGYAMVGRCLFMWVWPNYVDVTELCGCGYLVGQSVVCLISVACGISHCLVLHQLELRSFFLGGSHYIIRARSPL